MPTTPIEEQVLASAAEALAAISAGADYFFTFDACYRPVTAQGKHFAETDEGHAFAMIEPTDILYTQASPGVNCGTNADGTFIVTAATKYRGADDVKSEGFDMQTVQQQLVHDVRKALHEQVLVDGIPTEIIDRNLQVEYGGWAVVQVSCRWSGHEVL